MGVVQCNNNMDILFSKRVNITKYRCNGDCRLYHTNHVADLIAHFIAQYEYIFGISDVILIERQPPTGLTSIEALLTYAFRDKVKLISPNSMHAHFGMNKLNYEERKERTTSIASKYMTITEFRKHDIADALCIALFEIQRNATSMKNKRTFEALPFENFRL
jgi:hypothetical protein